MKVEVIKPNLDVVVADIEPPFNGGKALLAAGIEEDEVEFLLTHDWVERIIRSDGQAIQYVTDGGNYIVAVLPT